MNQFSNMIVLKKIISPILYFAALLLAVFVGIMIDSLINPVITDGDIGYGMSLLPGIELPHIVGLTAIIFFVLTTVIISRIEKLKKPKIKDHFRQSGVFYALVPFLVAMLIITHREYRYSITWAISIVFLGLILLAILINGVYLYLLKNKVNIINH